MKKTKTQNQIIEKWNRKYEKPLVSICCMTYNNEIFIKDALDGFLKQVTEFPYEVLIHDDASTDHTADIIREYEFRYPMLIKPIYNIENQYSKGVKPNIKFNFPRAIGKYISLCDGDDFWIDEYKLQKQVDFMEQNTDISLTFHDTKVVNENNCIINNQSVLSDKITYYNTEDIIKKWFIYTQTIMFKNDAIAINNEKYTKDFYGVINVDWSIQLICSINGKIAYLPHLKYASVYRKHHNSISSSIGKNRTYRIMKLILLFDRFDVYSDYKYHKEIEMRKMRFLEEFRDEHLKYKYKYIYYILNPIIVLKKLTKK